MVRVRETCLLLLLGFALSAEAGEPPIYSDTGQRLVLTPASGSNTVLGAVTVDLDGGRPDLVLWGFNWIQAFNNVGSTGPAPWFSAGAGTALSPNLLDIIAIRMDPDPQPELLALLGDSSSAELRRLDYVAGPTPGFILGPELFSGITNARRLATPFGNQGGMPIAVLRSGAPHLLLEQRFGSAGLQSLQTIPIDLGSANALGAVSAFIDGDARPELLIYGPGGVWLYSDRIPPLVGASAEIPTPGFEGPLAIGLAVRGAAVDIGVGKMGSDAILLHDPAATPLGPVSWTDMGASLGVLPTNAVISLDADQDDRSDLLFVREGQNSLHLGRDTGSPYDPVAISFGSGGRGATSGAYIDTGVEDLVIVNASGQAELWRARERSPRVQVRVSDGPAWYYYRIGSVSNSPVQVVLSPTAIDADLVATVQVECTDLDENMPTAIPIQTVDVTVQSGERSSPELPIPPPSVLDSECRYQIVAMSHTASAALRRAERPGLARYRGRQTTTVRVCEDVQDCGFCVFLGIGCGKNERCRTVSKSDRGPAVDWTPQVISAPRRLRDEVLNLTPGGRYFTNRYYAYGSLATAQMRDDPLAAFELTQRMAFAATPLVVSLIDEDGSATIPATLVDDVQALYQLVRGQADAGTQKALDADWQLLNLQAFSGHPVRDFSAHIATLAPDPLFADSFE